MENMIDIGGTIFKIDLNVYSNILTTNNESNTKSIEVETMINYDSSGSPTSSSVNTREFEKPKEIDGPKYDLLRMCLEILFTYNDEVDDSMGLTKALESTSIPFKVAFNTLLDCGILIEVDQE